MNRALKNPIPEPLKQAPPSAPIRSREPFQFLRHLPLKSIFRSPLFWGPLALKLALASFLGSHYLRDLFVPFVNFFVESGFSNPWDHFHALGRDDAFPYPPGMLYLLSTARILFSPLLAAGTDTATWLHLLSFRLPLLACDLGCLLLLLNWFPNRPRLLLGLYWASPIVLYATYCHGQLDLVPTALLLASLSLIHKKKFVAGMAVFGVCLATKSHVAVALPFLLVYLYPHSRWQGMVKAVAALVGSYLLLSAPFLASESFRRMVFQNPEQARLFALSLNFGALGQTVLLAPAALVALWYQFVSYRKWNWDLLVLYLGLTFCVFVLLTPPAPAYFLWSFPFVLFFLARNPRASMGAYWTYAFSYVLFYTVGEQPAGIDELQRVFPGWNSLRLGGQATSLIFTAMEASLAGLIGGIYLFGVRKNAIYHRKDRPISIGLAGDSGVGKDRLVGNLLDMLGRDRVTVTSGDDYHRWPRGHAKWTEHTPLNPKGNYLHLEQAHAMDLMTGKNVMHRHYDHDTGKFREGERVLAREFLIFSGLHSLSLQTMRGLYDLKVFVDPDESLRRYWKARRDIEQRGYSLEKVLSALERREADRVKYILPQRDQADLIIRPVAVNPADIDYSSPICPAIRMEYKASNSVDLSALAEFLSGTDGLKVEHDPFFSTNHQVLTVQGTIESSTLLAYCRELIPSLDDLTTQPQFPPNLEGCTLLVLLCSLDQQLRHSAHQAKI